MELIFSLLGIALVFLLLRSLRGTGTRVDVGDAGFKDEADCD